MKTRDHVDRIARHDVDRPRELRDEPVGRANLHQLIVGGRCAHLHRGDRRIVDVDHAPLKRRPIRSQLALETLAYDPVAFLIVPELIIM